METKLNKEKQLERISERLAELDSEELAQVEHVLDALERTKQVDLHYLGNFLGITFDFEQNEVKMKLGWANRGWTMRHMG